MLKITSTNILKDFEKGPIRRSLFSNGATSLFHEAKGLVGAKVSLCFLAGSVFESKEQEGLSHVIEHMVFKEEQPQIIKELELAGAQINAYTYKETVCFEMECLGEKLASFLPLFFELFFNLYISDSDLKKEKVVIEQELKEDMDDHETVGIEYIFKKNFGEALGHSIGGSLKNVRSFTKEQINNYHKKYYSPDRMTLTVVSGEKIDSLESLYIKAMDKAYRFKESKPKRIKALDRFGKITHCKGKLKRKVEQAIIFYSFAGTSLNSSHYYDYAVLDELLFEGLSSKFFIALREEQPLVYGLGSSINSFKSNGNYVMVFNGQKSKVKEIKRSVFGILEHYSKQPFDESEIAAIKSRMLDSLKLAFDSIDERAEYILNNEIYSLNEISMSSVEDKIKKVTSKSITKILNRLLSGEHSELIIQK